MAKVTITIEDIPDNPDEVAFSYDYGGPVNMNDVESLTPAQCIATQMLLTAHEYSDDNIVPDPSNDAESGSHG